MLYTPSHAELAQHPKTRKLARKLGVSIPTALGHLHLLWHFALKYAPDGDLSRFEHDDLADGCLWEGDGGALIDALADTGWLDRDRDAIAVHDWQEHGGKYVQRKEANAQRMRDARAKREGGTTKTRATHVQRTKPNAAHVQRTSGTRAEPEERRGEENRVEKKRVEDHLRGETPRATERERNPHWDALSEGLGFSPTTEAERKRFGKVVAAFVAASVTPAQIHTACENYSLHFDGAARTPEAILKHISQLQTTPLVRTNGHRQAVDPLEAKYGHSLAVSMRNLASLDQEDDVEF